MSGRKRKPGFADCDVACLSPFADDCPAIEDITVHVKSQKAKGASKELTFRVQYIVKLTKPCCSNHKPNTRIDVMSTNACFIDGADPAIFMMNRTIAKIKQHKKDKKFDGIDLCDLDIKSGMGSYYMLGPSKPSVWRLLWSSAENEMNKERLASMIRTTKQLQQHKEKGNKTKNKEWEKGELFANGNVRTKAISAVANALELCTGKSVLKATQVLSDLVSRLAQSPLFDQNAILTEDQKNNNTAMSAMFENARACIAGMKGTRKVVKNVAQTSGERKIKQGNMSKSNLSLFTGLAALFLTSTDSGDGMFILYVM